MVKWSKEKITKCVITQNHVIFTPCKMGRLICQNRQTISHFPKAALKHSNFNQSWSAKYLSTNEKLIFSVNVFLPAIFTTLEAVVVFQCSQSYCTILRNFLLLISPFISSISPFSTVLPRLNYKLRNILLLISYLLLLLLWHVKSSMKMALSSPVQRYTILRWSTVHRSSFFQTLAPHHIPSPHNIDEYKAAWRRIEPISWKYPRWFHHGALRFAGLCSAHRIR